MPRLSAEASDALSGQVKLAALDASDGGAPIGRGVEHDRGHQRPCCGDGHTPAGRDRGLNALAPSLGERDRGSRSTSSDLPSHGWRS